MIRTNFRIQPAASILLCMPSVALVPKVEKAMQACSICKDRLTKVQETLGQYFEKERRRGGPAGGDGVVKRVVQARPSSDGEDEEGIPF